MGPYVLLYLYRNRLLVHAAQELLAGLGVATAVALVFATLVASGSIAGSANEVVHAAIGPATLQVAARDANGLDGHMLERVEELPGVKRAAPILEQNATVLTRDGHHVTVDVTGATVSFALLNGLARTLPISTLAPGGIGLSQSTAKALGIATSATASTGQTVALKIRGLASRLNVSAVLGPETFGALSHAAVAVMPLPRLQQLAGLPGRVSRVLVEVKPGQEAAVRARLVGLAGGTLDVARADQNLALLRQALRPSNQASDLFAAISALLGFLFAFNALLLTVPERRQQIADLRMDGTERAAIVQMVISQGLLLGGLASALGLLAGYALTGAFHQSPGYLSQSFALGSSTVIGVKPLLLSLAGGLLATCVASAVPLLDLRRNRALDAVYGEDGVPGNALRENLRRSLFLLAVALLVLASVLFVLVPAAAIVVCVMLAVATMLTVPLTLAGVLRLSAILALRYRRLTLLSAALTSLRATTVSSLALAATGAVALFGSVALGGSRDDLLRGIGGYTSHYVAGADLWVVNPHDNQAINNFRPDQYAARISAVPGVAGVHTFQGSFLNYSGRRVWVIAWPPNAHMGLLDEQVVAGSPADAVRRVREGGWITVSAQIASEHHAGIGDTLRIATPTGEVPFKIAATTTNFGWTPGAVLMSTADYSRAWNTSAPSAIGVDLAPHANAAAVGGSIQRALGANGGLEVLSANTRQRTIDASASEGLSQLGEIAGLLLAAAILAMSAALGSNIWQRRSSLAGLRLDGTTPQQLRRLLLLEAALMLGAGCLTGAVAGIYGQIVIDGYLKHVTGFPVASFATSRRPLEIFALVIACVLAITAIPGWFASRVSPILALDE
jgi:putative ABC transport system permease protein